MLFFYAEGKDRRRPRGGRPADHGAGALIAARGARRPWGGRAYCSPRGAPTMGRARLLQPEGRADHGAGALVAARGARRPWGGGSHRTRRTFPPTMGGRAYCSPRDAPTMGRGFPPTEGRTSCRPWDGCACCSPRDAPTMGGRACCSPRDAPTMGGRAYHSPRGAPTMGRARLLQQRRGRTCRYFFPIMSFGKLYEAGKRGAQQGIQGVCKAKAWQSGKAIF